MENQENPQAQSSAAGAVHVIESSSGRGLKIALTLVGVISVGLVFGLFALWFQKDGADHQVVELNRELATAQSEVEELEYQLTVIQDAADVECVENDLPTVYVSRSAYIPDEVMAMLTDRLINPYVDYYHDKGEVLLVIDVDAEFTEDEELVAYPNTLTAHFYPSGMHSFVIDRTGEEIEWWQPDGEMFVEFSDMYRETYPEVVDQWESIHGEVK